MDEVITCKCGNQAWVLGVSGVRCSKCGYWLSSNMKITYDVIYANEKITGEANGQT